MNFFDHQDQARKKSRWLILLFIVAVIAITVAVDAIVVLTVVNAGDEVEHLMLPSGEWLAANPELLIGSSLGVIILIASASLYRMARLSGGGGVVARSMGGTLVPADTRDPKRRQLRNVVEEMAIASGIPVPEIYVLEKEDSINAFAAGYSAEDAAIAVSRGCLDKLKRTELQGVIAHEFSHVFNGDMRLNIRLIGVLFGILMIGLAGRQVLRLGYYGGSKKNGAPMLAIGLGLMAVGFIGLFFGRWIQAAVSRQREFLADASAVQFTRDPDGISGALKKIAATQSGSMLEADGEEVGHMLFADGVGRNMMATHPPIMDRIRAVDPQFSPRELADIASKLALNPDGVDVEPEPEPEPKPAGGGAAGGALGPAVLAGAIALEAGGLVDDVGTLSWTHVAYAAELIDRLPDPLHEAVHEDRRSVDVVMALLVDRRETVRERQLALIEAEMGQSHRVSVESLLEMVSGLEAGHRLPLIELALPVLKRRPKAALKVYLEVIRKLIRADGEVDVFEYALSRLVSVYLVQALKTRQSDRPSRLGRIHSVREDVVAMFAVVSDLGHDDPDTARRAFNDGIDHLFPMDPVEFEPPEDWVSALDAALDRVDRLVPLMKEQVVEGLVQTLVHDGQITLTELEVLRAICASIHCPMPPKISAQ